MVPFLEIIIICTPRLFPRPMMCFVSIIHHKIACAFIVTSLTWVSISEYLGTILFYPFLVLMMSFTGIACATTVIGPFTTLVNFLYLIAVGPAHSPSSWVSLSIVPPQFIKTCSILIGSFSNSLPLWVIYWTLLSYHRLKIATPIRLCVCLQMVSI